MPTFTRTAGGAQPVVATGGAATLAETTGVIASTGIGKPVQAFGITANASVAAQMGTNEAVETILRTCGAVSTVLAYQVDDTLVSVLLEEGAFTAATLQSNLNTALGGTFTTTVTDVGFKLALS